MPTPVAIPWEFTGSSAHAGTWVWATPHFQITVISAGSPAYRSYQWSIQDLSQGEPWTFAEGTQDDFNSAKERAVEYALKSYPHHGYSRYAPHLTSTYTLRGGIRVDLAHLSGQPVSLDVVTPAGEVTYQGNLVVGGHDIVIRTRSGEWGVRPETVVRVTRTTLTHTPGNGHPSGLPSHP